MSARHSDRRAGSQNTSSTTTAGGDVVPDPQRHELPVPAVPHCSDPTAQTFKSPACCLLHQLVPRGILHCRPRGKVILPISKDQMDMGVHEPRNQCRAAEINHVNADASTIRPWPHLDNWAIGNLHRHVSRRRVAVPGQKCTAVKPTPSRPAFSTARHDGKAARSSHAAPTACRSLHTDEELTASVHVRPGTRLPRCTAASPSPTRHA